MPEKEECFTKLLCRLMIHDVYFDLRDVLSVDGDNVL